MSSCGTSAGRIGSRSCSSVSPHPTRAPVGADSSMPPPSRSTTCTVGSPRPYGQDPEIDLADKPAVLRRLQADVFWLIDATDQPVNHLPPGPRRAAITAAVPQLVSRCCELAPRRGVVICHRVVYQLTGPPPARRRGAGAPRPAAPVPPGQLASRVRRRAPPSTCLSKPGVVILRERQRAPRQRGRILTRRPSQPLLGREDRPVAVGARPALTPTTPITELPAKDNAIVFCMAVWPLRRMRNASRSCASASWVGAGGGGPCRSDRAIAAMRDGRVAIRSPDEVAWARSASAPVASTFLMRRCSSTWVSLFSRIHR